MNDTVGVPRFARPTMAELAASRHTRAHGAPGGNPGDRPGHAVLCVDCGQPTSQRPRCAACAAKNPTPRHGHDWTWTKIRRAFIAEHPNCAGCGAKAKEVDHVIPMSEGGTHAASNLRSLCLGCHNAKRRRENRERWRKWQC